MIAERHQIRPTGSVPPKGGIDRHTTGGGRTAQCTANIQPAAVRDALATAHVAAEALRQLGHQQVARLDLVGRQFLKRRPFQSTLASQLYPDNRRTLSLLVLTWLTCYARLWLVWWLIWLLPGS